MNRANLDRGGRRWGVALFNFVHESKKPAGDAARACFGAHTRAGYFACLLVFGRNRKPWMKCKACLMRRRFSRVFFSWIKFGIKGGDPFWVCVFCAFGRAIFGELIMSGNQKEKRESCREGERGKGGGGVLEIKFEMRLHTVGNECEIMCKERAVEWAFLWVVYWLNGEGWVRFFGYCSVIEREWVND